MKKIFSLAIAAVAAFTMAASPAAAQTVLSIHLGASQTNQVQNGNVTQRALSAAAAVGSTGIDADVSSTAVNAVQLSSMEVDVSQTDSTLANASAFAAQANQVVNGAVDQASASIAGTGNLGAGSSITSTAANLGTSASITVKVTQ